MTVVEVVIALSVLVVAASIFGQLLMSATRLRRVNREVVVATEAARVVLEEMRSCAFLEIYRRYNREAGDDPAGAGTSPGHLFEVEGLVPLASASQGKQGRIVFPEIQVTSGGGGKKAYGAGGGTSTSWQLRETYVDEALGCPRDLDGNNVIDSANHTTNYLILPVRIEVDWEGVGGARHIEIVTQFADYHAEDGE